MLLTRGGLLPLRAPPLRRCVAPRPSPLKRRAVERDVEGDPLGKFCPVPIDQQPIQELKELQEILLFDWATLPFNEFMKKLAFLWTGICVISFPVSAATFDPMSEPVPFFIAGSCGSLFIVMIVVFRLFLGWSHVGQRLVSETVEYEESGWYDGQIWTKTQDILYRDRLESNCTVKPALDRLKTTLLTVSGSFVTCLLVLSFIQPSHPPPPTREEIFARASAIETEDYWTRVRKFEPWLFEDTEDQ